MHQPVEADSEIRNVVALLALRADRGDLEEYVDLYTPDADWELPGAPRHGHADIRAGAAERRRTATAGPGSHTRHVVTTVAVAVDPGGTEAVAESVWLFYVDTAGTPRVQSMGSYRDTLVATPAGWKVRRREITLG